MWTRKNRARYDRSKLRYPSDLTDDEWGLVEPLIAPGQTSGARVGQKAKYSARADVFRSTPESGLKSGIARDIDHGWQLSQQGA
jgi:transposase